MRMASVKQQAALEMLKFPENSYCQLIYLISGRTGHTAEKTPNLKPY